jgi:hypothetical protein
MGRYLVMACLAGAILSVPSVQGKDDPSRGLIAVSAGDSVALIDPTTGAVQEIPAGPVAWLFPAPGGTLFAPDLVHGTTTVIDLVSRSVRDRLDGVTMPHFGTNADRYFVVAGRLLVVSYPDRALINSFEIAFQNPWQVAVIADDSVLLVLERDPSGDGPASMVAVNLGDGQMVYRRPLRGDVRRFALSPPLAVIAMGDVSTGRVVLTDPATLTAQAEYAVGGKPMDLVFVETGSVLAVASQLENGSGELILWKIKGDKKHGLVLKKEWRIELDGVPVRIASSPEERFVAIGFADGRVQVVDVDSKEIVLTTAVTAAPRDVVWCDPTIPGPVMPEWSDDDAPTLDLGG